MRCFEVKQILQENFTAAGVELEAEVKTHLDACVKCREYLQELNNMASALIPLDSFELTPEESLQLTNALDAQLIREPAPIPVQDRENRIFPIARILLSAAAVILMVILSTSPTQDISIADTDYEGVIEYSSLDDETMTSIFFDNDDDLLPSLFDQTSAAYLASQLRPGQVDDVFESITDEELAWLEKNFSLEI
ncbi:MAG: hypothetical protein KAR42_02270 [candidate division Zixibacteria bacterium]|nr:hypothetical protein [candidate division Zixibacteria bacterium]